ncbi:MAG: histidine--tRNA ligase [Candidatus Latescibacteria bacterium]|nr:histidine--tRNA ligase [Candidatus Latescibacterota bacterium]NIM21601.1 histidine--tRNA ligase [Candidatus Latescibacterota bacterium]NIM64580.1 histidine--tRNA ligase [Candidatus Latescibacterota bacterium]NIO01095.1 histidine--tRNA ligase [Candidatus Latescibacterota bacterium]NIO27488.1 histidine--tRNA ligase [Candidatus Latescibacterota bacterium]
MKYKRPRGTQDIVPPAVHIWREVEEAFKRTFEKHCYEQIRTPIFESTELFERAVGEQTDIISKEMYTFTDRGGRSLTLRPENTASVIRAYLESGMHRRGGIVRLYYIGPMFRYDRPQAGRYRQFHQVGLEAIGGASPAIDVEVIETFMITLEELGFRGLMLKLNSVGCRTCRGPYRKLLLKALDGVREVLCSDCEDRAFKNPLRVFDCKRCEGVKEKLPTILANLCKDCRAHYDAVKAALEALGRSFEEDPYLVRGLDYYTRTAFEVIHGDLGAQNALCGGGRYDDLVEQCGGPPTPAIGYSAGLERIISVLPKDSPVLREAGVPPDIYVACVDEGGMSRALKIASLLRSVAAVEADFSMRSLKTQLRSAEKSGAKIAAIVDSSSRDEILWKNLAERKQVGVPDGDILDFAKRTLAASKEDGA